MINAAFAREFTSLCKTTDVNAALTKFNANLMGGRASRGSSPISATQHIEPTACGYSQGPIHASTYFLHKFLLLLFCRV